MNLANISSNGQIPLPVEIRRLPGLKSGDNVLFVQNQAGEIVISNASVRTIYKAQTAFESAAGKMGVKNENDIPVLVDEMRKGALKPPLESCRYQYFILSNPFSPYLLFLQRNLYYLSQTK